MHMEPMSFWQLVENNPEWVGVFANALFALVTITVIIWQVCVMKAQVRVMKWQGRTSARHERMQNQLIRLEIEHSWLQLLNDERSQILKMARKLHLAAGCLKEIPSDTDKYFWEEVQDTVRKLRERLRTLDVAVYSGPYGNWFFELEGYAGSVMNAVIADGNFNAKYGQEGQIVNLSTRNALKEADDLYKPTDIFLNLETAIRMEFFEFKGKWDALLP